MYRAIKYTFIVCATVFFIGVVILGNSPEDAGEWLGNVVGQFFAFFQGLGNGSSSSVS